VIGGLSISTLITLILIPVAYMTIHDIFDRRRARI
jgi:multidrug efflux pump subunit AcrB